MSRRRPFVVRLWLCALLVALTSCSTPSANDATVDVDATFPDAVDNDAARACTDFGGLWTLGRFTCPTMPLAVCIVQNGCEIVQYEFGAPASPGQAETTAFTTGRGCTFSEIAPGTMSVVCTSADGSQRCLATATRADTPAAAPVCCNPFANDCEAGRRCGSAGWQTDDGQFIATSACFPGGQRREGERCDYDSQGSPDMLCVPGLECIANVCRPLCDANGEPCAAPNFCAPVSDAPLFGACVPGCTLIEDTGCPMDQSCRLTPAIGRGPAQPARGFCTGVGAQPIGGECDELIDCPARTGCFYQGPSGSPGHCLSLCHIGTDECGPGYRCVTLVQPMATEIGYCAPL